MEKNSLKFTIPTLMLVVLIGSAVASNDTNVLSGNTGSAQAKIPSLTDAEKELAKEIAERELADLLKGKRYVITEVGVSHRGSEKLGAFVLVEFKDFYWMTVKSGDWEHTGWVDGLAANVDLEKKAVGGISVAPSRYTIGKNVGITVDQVQDKRFKKAAEKALSSEKVKKRIAGKGFKTIPDSVIKHSGSEYITLFVAINEGGEEERFPVLIKDGDVYLEDEVM